MTRKPSEWNKHVKETFASGRAAKGKSYSFKQALTDAAKTWKSHGTGASSKSHKKKKHQSGGDDESMNMDSSNDEMSPYVKEDGPVTNMGGGKKKRKSTKKAKKSKKSGKKTRKAKK